MNNEVKKIPETDPKGYGPKKPEILDIAKKNRLFGDIVTGNYIISNVPAADNPDVGGCGQYLECFSALQAYLEQIPTEEWGDYRNRICMQYLLTAGISLSTIWSELSAPDNYCFESPILFEATYGACGYGYDAVDPSNYSADELYQLCVSSIAADYPVIVCYQCDETSNYEMLKRGWRLYVGYNTAEKALIYNDNGEYTENGTWADNIEKIIFITETGLQKPDIRDILRNTVVAVEMPSIENRVYGYTAYQKLIDYLSDDNKFFAMTDEELDAAYQALEGFFWSHAESRGNTGGGADSLYNGILKGTDMAELIGQIMFYGYNGHQISYVGATALDNHSPAELKENILRPKLIYCAKMLMDNDNRMLSLIKESIGMKTLAVLLPTDGDYACYDDMRLWDENAPVTDRCLKNPERADADAIAESCIVKKTHHIDFTDDLEVVNTAEYRVDDGILHIKHDGSRWEPTGALSTKEAYTLPLKIDAVITGEDRPLMIAYNNRPMSGWGAYHYGFVANYDWAKHPGDFVVKDVYLNYAMDYKRTIAAADAEETEVSWIIHRDYMAVLVNGQVVHYEENMPYMHFDVPAMPVRIGSLRGRWAKVKSLTVTELE